MKTGIELIAEERKEQIEKHGYTIAEDDDNDNNELVDAAMAILLEKESLWPWNNTERIIRILKKDRIEQLKIAGALMAAEIDRIANHKPVIL